MTYECTVVGDRRGVTIWTGTALNCPSDEVLLFHRRFTRLDRITCNNGATVAQILHTLNNSYTSQLNITVTRDIDGTSITCVYEDCIFERNIHVVGQFLIQLPGIIYSTKNTRVMQIIEGGKPSLTDSNS